MERESQEYLKLADKFQDTVMSEGKSDRMFSLNSTGVMSFTVQVSEPPSFTSTTVLVTLTTVIY